MPDETTPDDAEQTGLVRLAYAGKTYLFGEAVADNVELMDLENVMGVPLGDWADMLNRGSVRAVTALVWLMRRRDEPALAFADVRFRMTEVSLEMLSGDDAREALGKEAPSSGS